MADEQALKVSGRDTVMTTASCLAVDFSAARSVLVYMTPASGVRVIRGLAHHGVRGSGWATWAEETDGGILASWIKHLSVST